jgi:fumarate hydratase class I
MIQLTYPFTEAQVRALKVGDEVSISGVLFTGRDAVHKYLHEGGSLPAGVSFKDGIIYHCGPVMMPQADGSWKCTAAGPTTSIREEPYQWQIIRDFGVRGVIGKGGMGKKTSEGLQKTGAVYLHATGGAGSLLAERVKRVVDVKMLEEFGSPEAFWIIEVEDFPLVVTMDSHGGSLHEIVAQQSQERAKALMA